MMKQSTRNEATSMVPCKHKSVLYHVAILFPRISKYFIQDYPLDLVRDNKNASKFHSNTSLSMDIPRPYCSFSVTRRAFGNEGGRFICFVVLTAGSYSLEGEYARYAKRLVVYIGKHWPKKVVLLFSAQQATMDTARLPEEPASAS